VIFLVNLDDFFILVCTGFHSRLVSIAYVVFKDKVLYGFIAAAERTFGAALPFSLHLVVFRQASHLRRTDPPQILLKETRSGCRQEEEAYVGANLRPTHEMH